MAADGRHHSTCHAAASHHASASMARGAFARRPVPCCAMPRPMLHAVPRVLLRRPALPSRGMVESAFEFAEVCRKHDFHNFVYSMKASNPLVMVQVGAGGVCVCANQAQHHMSLDANGRLHSM